MSKVVQPDQNKQTLQEGDHFDVVVVGAGMVGASTALGLSQLGQRILLIDAFNIHSSITGYTPSYDARSTALSWGSKEILSQLSVWPDIAEHACAISQVHVSEQGKFGTTRMTAGEFEQSALGYVVPNQWLGQCLLANIDQEDICFCSATRVEAIQALRDRQQLTLRSDDGKGLKVSSRLLVISDGADSKTARFLGIESDEELYSQHALIANVTTSLPNNGVAYERFTPKGPLALLPISENTSSLVWTRDSSEINDYLNMNEAEFCKALELEFGERLGLIEKCGERVSYPLKLMRAKEQYRQGVLLLGNAAHSLHPVAGQGFNLALRGVAAFLESVSQNVADASAAGPAFESLESLNKLCQERQRDQSKTIFLSDQLIKIFGSKMPVLSVLRDLGRVGLDNTPHLKSLFAAQTMGLAEKKTHFAMHGGRK